MFRRSFPLLSLSSFPWTPAAFFLTGAALCARGWSLGPGRADATGPGLWPAVVGGGLMVCGALLAATSGRSPKAATTVCPAPDGRALKGLLLGCLAWLALFTSLGWLPATLAAGLIFSRSAGNGWRSSFILAALVIGGLGVGVEYLLRFPLPGGFWGRVFTAPAVWLSGPGGPA